MVASHGIRVRPTELWPDGVLPVRVRIATDEVRRVVRISLPFVHRNLWVGTERTQPVDHTIDGVRGYDHFWRGSTFHPLFQSSLHVE